MEAKDLLPIVITILLVGMISGIGVLVLDKFADNVKSEAIVTDQNTTSSVSSGEVTAPNDEIVTLSGCRDATNETNLNTGTTCNLTNAELGTIKVNEEIDGALLNLNYTYEADSASSLATDSSRDAVADISEDWLSLVVAIIILSVILGLTITSFANNMGR